VPGTTTLLGIGIVSQVLQFPDNAARNKQRVAANKSRLSDGNNSTISTEVSTKIGRPAFLLTDFLVLTATRYVTSAAMISSNIIMIVSMCFVSLVL
jgi:hypothetical protein